jgi:hypothetical protein
MISLTSISNFAKKVILPTVEAQLQDCVPLMDHVKKNADVVKLANDSFYVTLRVGRHTGIGWTNAKTTSNLITGGSDSYSQATVLAAYGYGTFRIDHKVLQVKEGTGAIVSILKAETEGLLTDFAKHINRQWSADGTGRIALANGAGNTTATLTVDTPGTLYMEPGMNILIGTTAATILTVDSDTQVTLTATKSWSDNDVIHMADGDGSAATEMMGIAGFADGTAVTTLQGIARSGHPWWSVPTAQAITSGAVLAESTMTGIYTRARQWAVGKPKYVWFLSTNMYLKYGSLLVTYKKSADLSEKLVGGWKGLTFMEDIPVVCNPDLRDGEGYLVDTNMLTWATLADLDFIPGTDDAVLIRVPGTSLYEATAALYGNLATKNVRHMGYFQGQTVS